MGKHTQTNNNVFKLFWTPHEGIKSKAKNIWEKQTTTKITTNKTHKQNKNKNF